MTEAKYAAELPLKVEPGEMINLMKPRMVEFMSVEDAATLVTDYAKFVELCMRDIARAIGVPYEQLSSEWPLP